MSQITIVNLNPCIDWQYSVSQFTPGGLNRVCRTYQGVGGKGINVAIALKNLGKLNNISSCIGFNFSNGGEKVTQKFNALNIPHNFITVEGDVRVNIKLYDGATGTMTELNQPGDIVPAFCVNKLLDDISKISQTNKNGILVLSGSLPGGVSEDIYATATNLWVGKVFLDTSGEVLKAVLKSEKKPYAIKPNLFELESTFGVKLSTPQDVVQFCKKNIAGVELICVSMGADGAILVTPQASYFCPALDVTVRGVQGAGDSMVAGIICGILENVSDAELLRYAVAAATASIIRDGTSLCERTDFEKMLKDLPLQLCNLFPGCSL